MVERQSAAKVALPGDPGLYGADLAQLHVADIVETLNDNDPGVAVKALLTLPPERTVDVFNQPSLERPAALVQALPVERAAAIVQAMRVDRRADLFRRLDPAARTRLLEQLAPAAQATLQQILAYPANTAGSIMTTEFISLTTTMTVAQALQTVREVGHTQETVYALYLLDPATKALVQAISLRDLILGDADAPVASVAHPRRPISIAPETDRAEVTRLIAKYDLLALPVVDGTGHVLGIVTVDDVIDEIVEEATEDVQRFGGTEALGEAYLLIGFWQMIKKRGGWLCALFISEMLTASAMQHYEDALEKAVVLTLFIPLIMSSGGNSGSQATSLLIRALALREINLGDWWRVALRELPTGLTLGAMLGVVGIIRITLWQKLGLYDYGEHWTLIALTVGAALVGIVTFGSLTGSMLPFLLRRLGFDPASASAPFVATLVDVTGLVIYFTIASIILRGTLL